MFIKNKLTLAVSALSLMFLVNANTALAGDDSDGDSDSDSGGPALTGNCAQLPADRTTEFHGNPATSNLNLAMAGNQWVVFDHFMQAFNEYRAAMGEDIDPHCHR